jgi:hypothetical protein
MPIDPLLSNIPVKDIDERWQQRIHQACGGELVVITRAGEEAFCCKKCKAIWNIQGWEAPIDWAIRKPERVGSGLWVPGKIL